VLEVFVACLRTERMPHRASSTKFESLTRARHGNDELNRPAGSVRCVFFFAFHFGLFVCFFCEKRGGEKKERKREREREKKKRDRDESKEGDLAFLRGGGSA